MESETDQDTIQAVARDVENLEKKVGELEFRRMFSGETNTDANEVCLRLFESNGDFRTSLWTPVSVRNQP